MNTFLLKEAIAVGLEMEMLRFGEPSCYLTNLAKDLERKRDFVKESLRSLGLSPVNPQGGIFMIADWTRFAKGN